MGKAADNEKIKLEAQYYNGLAIGILIAGWFLPSTALFLKIVDQGFSWVTTISALIAISAAQYLSMMCRKVGQIKISSIKD